MTIASCPCGSQKPYADCCGPFHAGTGRPQTAAALMRSRYSAFALQLKDYLVTTLHPDKRRPDEAQALAQSFQNTEWLGLSIIQTGAGTEHDDKGTVEFVAYYRSGSQQGQLHERSRFVKKGEQWLYVDGDMLPAHTSGRNDPCWCGSGKKFKKCHG